MTNAVAGNGVVVFDRMRDGSLKAGPTISTGGLGTGAGLGSQGAIALSDSHRWLLVANAGSNDVTVFNVDDDRLTKTGKFPSGGATPISITVHGRLVYVLNAGSPNNISGFFLGFQGTLTPISNSTRALSAAATGPAQVQFSPDGDMLVVTEKATNRIDVFNVGPSGVPGALVSNASHGMTPFGFAFGRGNQILVSEAFGGAASASAVSSYIVRDNGTLMLETGSAATHQTAACWVVVTPYGRFAYTTNTGSGSVTGFRVGVHGELSGLNADGRTGLTPAGPIDASFSNGGQFLYVLTSTGISEFRVDPDGGLWSIGLVPVPFGSVGLAAQ
ncbi:MAG: beta-propeller fold lactonase family protein [Candidatus Solibacter sp.]